MKIGMLWFDNDPKSDLKVKIERAMSYYSKKYGHNPTLCYVHPSMVANGNGHSNGIEIRANRSVLPNHFWIGISETQAS
jgi:hypothetical protein